MAIPQEFLDELLDRIDIVELIGQRVPLKSRGVRHVACCPFHDEKTPSFTVDAHKQFFYCFGCRASGTAINFLMRKDGLDFISAVRQLAAQHGMEIPDDRVNTGRQRRFRHLADILDAAAQFYRQSLKENHKASQYLDYRKIRPEVAAEMRVGYAPAEWDGLIREFDGRYSNDDLLAVGLIKTSAKSEDRLYDVFRDRLMFPIRNMRGQTVGFGGRALDSGNPAKYLNTPGTDLFHKKSEIYGLHEAMAKRDPGKDGGEIYLVEGYMDVVALKCHGMDNAVACMGTAVNGVQLHKLLKKCQRLILCFDGDSAGEEAAWRAALELAGVIDDGDQIGILFLPEGEDPDSWLEKSGVEGWREHRADHLMEIDDFLYRRLSAGRNLSSLSDRAAYARQAISLCKNLKSALYRQLILESLAKRAGLDSAGLEALTAQKAKAEQRAAASRAPQRQRPASRRIERSKWDALLSILLAYPALIDRLADDEALLYMDSKRRQIQDNCPSGCLRALLHCHQGSPDISSARQLLSKLHSQEAADGQEHAKGHMNEQRLAHLRALAMGADYSTTAGDGAGSGIPDQASDEIAAQFNQLRSGLRKEAQRMMRRERLNKINSDNLDEYAAEHSRARGAKAAESGDPGNDA